MQKEVEININKGEFYPQCSVKYHHYKINYLRIVHNVIHNLLINQRINRDIHNENNIIIAKEGLFFNELSAFIHKFNNLCIILIHTTTYCL